MPQLQISLEIAEHVLARHLAIHGMAISPFKVIAARGLLPKRPSVFESMDRVRDDIQLRNQRIVAINPVFRLQQRLATEAAIAERWPEHRSQTIPLELTFGLAHDEMHLFSFNNRRRFRQRKT